MHTVYTTPILKFFIKKFGGKHESVDSNKSIVIRIRVRVGVGVGVRDEVRIRGASRTRATAVGGESKARLETLEVGAKGLPDPLRPVMSLSEPLKSRMLPSSQPRDLPPFALHSPSRYAFPHGQGLPGGIGYRCPGGGGCQAQLMARSWAAAFFLTPETPPPLPLSPFTRVQGGVSDSLISPLDPLTIPSPRPLGSLGKALVADPLTKLRQPLSRGEVVLGVGGGGRE